MHKNIIVSRIHDLNFLVLQIRIVKIKIFFFCIFKTIENKGVKGRGGGSMYLVPVESIFKINIGVPISKKVSHQKEITTFL